MNHNDEQPTHSVTQALAKGPAENRDFIVTRSEALFAGIWKKIALEMIPAKNRRAADEHDIRSGGDVAAVKAEHVAQLARVGGVFDGEVDLGPVRAGRG